MLSLKKHPLLLGTFILTATGFLSRLIGFFYRIYLSRLFGEEGMGVYQLITPVLFLSFSLTAAGFQTTISKFVAEYAAAGDNPLKPFLAGTGVSVLLSVLCTAALFTGADRIAVLFLKEPRCTVLLKILAFSIPPGTIHACINGYFYGIKKTGVPAASQLLEQCVRVLSVYLITARIMASGNSPSIAVAVLGMTLGEIVSMLFSVLAMFFRNSRYFLNKTSLSPGLYRSLLSMVIPLTANRLTINILQSIESVSIPSALRLYGYDSVTALSVYGVLTGMALPLIFFPNALTGSVSVLLLPIISENYALGNLSAVRKATTKTVSYCFAIGFACLLFFLLLGNTLGNVLFHSSLAGYFIVILGFTCPFCYLNTTLSGILQGLGRAGRLFLINIACLILRLLFVVIGIPRIGIKGYLWGVLLCQLTMSILYLYFINKCLSYKKTGSV